MFAQEMKLYPHEIASVIKEMIAVGQEMNIGGQEINPCSAAMSK
jgi:hypothetical protein